MVQFYFQNFYESDNVYIQKYKSKRKIKLYKNKCVGINFKDNVTYYNYIVDDIETYNKMDPIYINSDGKIMNYIITEMTIPQTLVSINILYSYIQHKYIVFDESIYDSPANISTFNTYLYMIENGHIDAMLDMGEYYDIEGDDNKSTYYYNMAIQKGSTRALIALGDSYYLADNYSMAVDYYNQAAIKNDVDAIMRLGKYYEENREYKLMKKYYLQAIKLSNNRDAYVYLAKYYYNKHKYYKMKKYLFNSISILNKYKYAFGYEYLGIYYYQREFNYDCCNKINSMFGYTLLPVYDGILHVRNLYYK